jgi:hypothetical protein
VAEIVPGGHGRVKARSASAESDRADAEYDTEWKNGGKNHPPDHKEWSEQQEKRSKEEDKHAKEMEKEGKGHPKVSPALRRRGSRRNTPRR